MGISQFPAPDTGGGLTNDFILDKNDTTNNVFEPGRSFEAGGYSIVVTGSTAYDLYLLDSTGSAVGYTNGTSIVASGSFESIAALGLGTADVVSFTYNGPSTNAGTAGTETGAGAYLTSITPSDLPQIDDTAIVAGGNFASDVQITFTSGTVELSAKNVVVGSSTALVVTRPDGLIEDLAPYDLVAVNPGITPPSGSNANVLAGTVTAGTDPSFVTTSPIFGAFPGSAFSTAILVSDSEGTVVSWEITSGELPAGLSFGTADGSIAGTVAGTATGSFDFTVQITDDGDNTNSQAFTLPVGLYVAGGSAVEVGGTAYNTFLSTDDLVVANVSGTANLEYIIVAGGGSGNGSSGTFQAGGGGGAGGLVWGTAAITSDSTLTVSIGAGGAPQANGANSYIDTVGTAFGGGYGGNHNSAGGAGGSGGGGGGDLGTGGAGTAGQGFAGGNGGYDGQNYAGGGGGAAEAGNTDALKDGGDGLQFGAWASAVSVVFDGGYFAGGGGGGRHSTGNGGVGGLGGGADGVVGGAAPNNGEENSGGGAGGTGANPPSYASGGAGIVLVRTI